MNQTNKSFKKFLLLWSGELVSAIGSGITAFGLGVYVFNLTGKASAMAFVTLIAFVPPIFLGMLAGVLADRYDRRFMMILGNVFTITGLGYILFWMYHGGAQIWQIYVGVGISAIFSSFLDPAYRATVTDLLDEDQYSKASGLVQMAGSAKYLISPIVAGALIALTDVKMLLIVDIGSFLFSVIVTLIVRKGIATKKTKKTTTMLEELKEGVQALLQNKGVFTLAIMIAVLTFFVSFIEILSLPMVLSFQSSKVAGMLESVIATGMLFTSIFIGVIKIKKNFLRMLCISLFGVGMMMIGFGSRENILAMIIFGFLMFALLPFANTSLDYLIRINVDNQVQGRIWSLISVLSQISCVIAYFSSGILADYVFNPMFLENGLLVNTVGNIIGTGPGRGIGFLIILAGGFLSITAVVLYQIKSVKGLEI